MGLKLSDLKPEDIEIPEESKPSGLKLSDLKAEDIQKHEELPASEELPGIEKPEISLSESIGRAGAKGLTAGLTGVAAGLGGAAGTFSGGKRDWESLKQAYQEALAGQKQKEEQAAEAHPIASIGAEIAGSIPTLGLGAAKLGAAGIASPVAQAGILGGATGATTYLGETAEPTLGGAGQSAAIGTGLGVIGGKIGEKIGGMLTPERLEVAASKAASKAVGLKPSKEMTRLYDPGTGKMVEGSNIIKGIGKTALEEGAVPMTGGPENIYNKSLEAINHNYERLNPLIANTQQKLNQNLQQYIEGAGSINQKAHNFINEFAEQLEKNPDRNAILKKFQDKYLPYIDQISQVDGNLQQLNQFKRAIQDYATDLSAAAYAQPASDLKPEAEFVKRFGGILRQHIEDLASAADPGAGEQIGAINKTLGNLYTYKDAAKKMLDKSTTGLGDAISTGGALGTGFILGGPVLAAVTGAGKLAIEKGTGHPLSRLASMAEAKIANLASKKIQTPAGEIVQKAVTNVPLATVTNPFTQGRLQDKYGPVEASKLSTNLYTADDDSLKNIASNLKSTPGLEFYGEHLNKAIDSNDNDDKNRAIFLILQNPKSRKLVSPLKSVEEQGVKALEESLKR